MTTQHDALRAAADSRARAQAIKAQQEAVAMENKTVDELEGDVILGLWKLFNVAPEIEQLTFRQIRELPDWRHLVELARIGEKATQEQEYSTIPDDDFNR